MFLWSLVLVMVGLGLSVYSANLRMSARLDEGREAGPRAGSLARMLFRLGVGMLLLGLALFAINVVIHTIITVVTIVAVGVVVVGFFSLLGRLRRPRVH